MAVCLEIPTDGGIKLMTSSDLVKSTEDQPHEMQRVHSRLSMEHLALSLADDMEDFIQMSSPLSTSVSPKMEMLVASATSWRKA